MEAELASVRLHNEVGSIDEQEESTMKKEYFILHLHGLFFLQSSENVQEYSVVCVLFDFLDILPSCFFFFSYLLLTWVIN